MNKQAITHYSNGSYAFMNEEKKLIIRIKVASSDTKRVDLIGGDPYDWGSNAGVTQGGDNSSVWQTSLYQAKHKFQFSEYDIYEFKIDPEYKRFRYYFKIVDKNNNIAYYYENGLSDHELAFGHEFVVPYLHYNDQNNPPKWVNETVWYQIFPDRFNTNNPKVDWKKTKVSNETIFGGNIQGIIQKLDYLKELGINGIYLTPIFKAETAHKYDTVDYFQIDSDFGTMKDFEQLVAECKKRSIRLILDAVYNHTSKNHPFFQDVIKNGESSPYAQYYHINDYTTLEQASKLRDIRKLPSYETFAFTPDMPKLKTTNPEVKKYLLEVTKFWTDKGIDGWRLDVANEVDADFWRDFKQCVMTSNPDAYILGEIWHDATKWLHGDQFHNTMNYPLMLSLFDLLQDESYTTEQFKDYYLQKMLESTHQVFDSTFNLLDSHDTIRLLNRLGSDKNKAFQIICLLLSLNGSPSIYYGSEIALAGGNDPDNRRPMPWNKMDEFLKSDFYQNTKEFIWLRRNHKLFFQGEIMFIHNPNNKVLEFVKSDDKDSFTFVFNFSNYATEYIVNKEIVFLSGYEKDRINKNGLLILKNK
jgi:cyclomaltodextrinase